VWLRTDKTDLKELPSGIRTDNITKGIVKAEWAISLGVAHIPESAGASQGNLVTLICEKGILGTKAGYTDYRINILTWRVNMFNQMLKAGTFET
jgi:hypothetical protein